MTEHKIEGGGCPFHKKKVEVGASATSSTVADYSTSNSAIEVSPTALVTGIEGGWRPKSPRVGVPAYEYVLSQMLHDIMQGFNYALAKENRVDSWTDWWLGFGLLYAFSKLWYVRFQSIYSAHDGFRSNNVGPIVRAPRAAKKHFRADGRWNADHFDPEVAASFTRAAWTAPPDRSVRPEAVMESFRAQMELLFRHRDADGTDIEVLAGNLNMLFADWILFQVHGFFGITEGRCPVSRNPHVLKTHPDDGYPGDVMKMERAGTDPTRVTQDGDATEIFRTHQWTLRQVYGATEEETQLLRSHVKGKMRVDIFDGDLPEDPNAKGLPQVGFHNNLSMGSYFLHRLFVDNHNRFCDWLSALEPELTDDELFHLGVMQNVAGLSAESHTLPWTQALLQHPTTFAMMSADYAGFIGKRRKLALMRLFDRHPFLDWLCAPLRHLELYWGMPGSGHRQYSGKLAVPIEFRIAYRLHWLLRSEIALLDPRSREIVERYGLLDFVNYGAREMVKKHGLTTVLFSEVSQACGAPVLHNLPNALRMFLNQQDQEHGDTDVLTNLGLRDLLRELTSGTWSYNRFRKSLGERPVKDFMELTGGNAQLAQELSNACGGDIEKLHVVVGILASWKPEGNALSNEQLMLFALAAPRRYKGLWLMTDGFKYKIWGRALDWAMHSGGILGAVRRMVPELSEQMEGVDNIFKIWPDPKTLMRRLYEGLQQQTPDLVKADVKTFQLGAVTGLAAILTGAASPATVGCLLAAYGAGAFGLYWKRVMIMRDLERCWQLANSDMRHFMFGTLDDGKNWMYRAAFFGKLAALAVTGVGGYMAWQTWGTAWPVSVLFGLLALRGYSTRKLSDGVVEQAEKLAVVLHGYMSKPSHLVGKDEPEPVRLSQVTDLEGDNDLTRRYMYLRGDHKHPVATFRSCYEALRTADRLPPWTAFGTSLMSVLLFGRKSQKGLNRKQKWAIGIGPFDWFKIYIPGLVHAMSASDTGSYAAIGNEDGLTPGDVNHKAVDFLYDNFAPGLDYLTRDAAARAREWYSLPREGNGGFLKRLFGRLALKRRHDQLFMLYADVLREEDGELVVGVSKEQYIRFLQGLAHKDRARQLHEGSADPHPVAYTELETLVTANQTTLDALYAAGKATARPVGKTNGRALFIPGTRRGGLLRTIARLFWQGKVFGKDGVLVNRILGGELIKARVSSGSASDVSWHDGKPAIIIDYKGVSPMFGFIRDEIRELYHEGSEIYLGKAFIRLPFGGRWDVIYFALDFRTE